MDLLSTIISFKVYAREERHARGREMRERSDDVRELDILIRFREF